MDEKQPPALLCLTKSRGLTFADYNFDGVSDLALCDGNYSGYGGQSFKFTFLRRRKSCLSEVRFTGLAQAPFWASLRSIVNEGC